MEQKELTMLYMPLEELTEYNRNAKTHPDTQIRKIANSIRLYGFDQPISVDKEKVIIKGHGRFLASRLLGLKKVPVIVRDDLSLIEAAASRIADNKVAESAWDKDLLPLELNYLSEQGVDIEEGTGFDEQELKALFNNPEFEPAGEDEQGKLDKKELTECPHCGHQF